MNKEELQRIYNLILKKFKDVDSTTFTFEYFLENMSVTDGRLNFWKTYKNDLGLIKDFKQFEKSITSGGPEYYKPENRIPSTDKPDFKSKPCDENTYNWGYGCMNKKIGALNNKFFGNNYDGKYGDELLSKLRNLGLLSNTDTIITKEIFDKMLPNYGTIQESKIIKETVKNILLGELLKDI
jgi:hypothetical protein